MKKAVITLVAYLCMMTIAGCAADKKHESFLSLFFDGVLPVMDKKKLSKAASQNQLDKKTETKLAMLSVHPPFKEKSCSDCHNFDSQKSYLNAKAPDICLTCHNDAPFTKKNTHPALDIDESCLNCHNPHESGEKKLLRKPVVETCATCHEEKAKKLKHFPLKENPEACVVCHTPHSSEQEKLLKMPQVELCTTCHNPKNPRWPKAKMEEMLAYVKEGSVCTDCHNPHTPLDR
ncbi:MAG: hypothetical protein HZC03_00055 [Candidatus Lloydbacteria bacterium]|nr:hypothetical protein [Candidatus Lloydbacteria bacterium]